jgi:transposase
MGSQAFIGIDVSQRTLDIARSDEAQVLKIDYTEKAVRRWLKGLSTPCCIGVESTGTLHRLIVRLALMAGHCVYVLNARDLSHYAQSLGRRAKSDRLDALLIARYLAREHEDLHPYRLPSALQAKLDELIARRRAVVMSVAALRQSFKSCKTRLSAWGRSERALDSLVKQIDQQMKQAVAADPQLREHATRLRTLAGFGPLLSQVFAHALTRHDFLSADAFIAYIGYDPRPRDSGQQRGRRFLSKRGPAELRRLLYTAAMAAARTQLWKPIYRRYRDRGLASTAALVILARKLARVAFSIVKRGVEFDPKLIQNACTQS